MRIVRRLFVVPLANDKHGKTTMLRSLYNQAMGRDLTQPPKGQYQFVSPWGRVIDAQFYGRSYQEGEKWEDKVVDVESALDANDRKWRLRELIILPSHITDINAKEGAQGDDLDQMIDAAHGAGFDIICASVFSGEKEESDKKRADVWRKPWDERWTIPNPTVSKPDGQLEALGRDLWTVICRAMTP